MLILPGRALAVATSLWLGLLWGCSGRAPGNQTEQPTASKDGGDSVPVPKLDPARMRQDLTTLAADEFAGRYSLSPDHIERAARYIADQHKEAGLAPPAEDYLVEFQMKSGEVPSGEHFLWLDGSKGALSVEPTNFVSLASGNGQAVIGAIVDMGAAGKKPSKRATDTRGKFVLWSISDTNPQALASLRSNIEAVHKSGAVGVLLAHVGADSTAPKREEVGLQDVPIPVVWTDRVIATRLLGGQPAENRKPSLLGTQVSLAPKTKPTFAQVPNVLAVLPGTDLAREVVMVGAHYDHIGTLAHGRFCRKSDDGDSDDEICNGADDNASGTAMVLAIARALRKSGFKPRRTLVFAHFAGEELGLLGSEALAQALPQTPPFSGRRLVAMINLDMVGRLGDKGLSIYGESSSAAWSPMLDDANRTHGLKLVFESSMSGRSDHASFYERDVPVLFFFSGLHEDYHRTGDETDRINYAGMEKIAELVTEIVVMASDGRPIDFTSNKRDDEQKPGKDAATARSSVSSVAAPSP